MITTSKTTMTENEYLSFEETVQVRHEFFHRNLLEMSGGTIFHETLILNVSLFLKAIFGISDYKVFASGLKLRINPEKYFYPDVMLTNEKFSEIRFANAPIFISEVLSPATRTFDMVDKFLDYRSLPSLQYYLLAEPEHYHVTLHTKGADGTWQSDTYRKLTDLIDLPLIGAKLPMAEIYQGLVWE